MMRWTERRKSEYARTVETVSVIEELLGELFGLIQLETGKHIALNGEPRVDYLLNITDYEEARRISRELQYRHISSGVRPQGGRYVLRVSKNDLLDAFLQPEAHSHEGLSARALLEELVMQRRLETEAYDPFTHAGAPMMAFGT